MKMVVWLFSVALWRSLQLASLKLCVKNLTGTTHLNTYWGIVGGAILQLSPRHIA